jgi:hypothetical protein
MPLWPGRDSDPKASGPLPMPEQRVSTAASALLLAAYLERTRTYSEFQITKGLTLKPSVSPFCVNCDRSRIHSAATVVAPRAKLTRTAT